MNDRVSWRELVIALLFVAVLAISACLSMALDAESTKLLMAEGGVIETASAVGYFFCLAFLFWAGSKVSMRSHWYLYVLLLAMALRELDFDKRFTSTGVLKSKFLVANDVSFIAKVIGGSVVFLVIFAFVTWIVRHQKVFWRDVFQLKSRAWVMGFALAFIALTKSIDGIARKLEPLGIEVTEHTNELAARFEEIFELGIPITLLCAIYLYWRSLEFKSP